MDIIDNGLGIIKFGTAFSPGQNKHIRMSEFNGGEFGECKYPQVRNARFGQMEWQVVGRSFSDSARQQACPDKLRQLVHTGPILIVVGGRRLYPLEGRCDGCRNLIGWTRQFDLSLRRLL